MPILFVIWRFYLISEKKLTLRLIFDPYAQKSLIKQINQTE